MSAPNAEYVVTRPVTKGECGWLPRDLAEGERVFAFVQCTYGVIGPGGIAVSFAPDEHSFFEVPMDALLPAPSDGSGAQ